jgi:hypothetical protein
MTELFTVWQTSGPLQQQQDIQSLQQPQTGHPNTSAVTNRTSNHFSSHKQNIQSLQQPQTEHPITSAATNRTSNHFSSHKQTSNHFSSHEQDVQSLQQPQTDIQSLQQPQTGHPITSAINEVRTTTTYHGCRAVEQNDLLTRSTEQPEVT